jgi:branched-subunit amino acid aminotransferase/4-amino-4-deoxychorismate lyase
VIQVYWKGKLRKPKEVTISPVNTGLFYGESLFESIPVYRGVPLYLREHLGRLKKGCRFLGWPFVPESEFRKAISLFTRHLGIRSNFLIRFNLVQELKESTNPRQFSSATPSLFAVTRSLRHDPQSAEPFHGRIGISPWLASDQFHFPNHFKTAVYLTTREVFRKHAHWDDVLRLNDRGYVVDGGSSAPLWYDGKKICAPPLMLGGLESVTRGKILTMARKIWIRVVEKTWKPSDVLKRGELFLVGSGVGVMAVSHLQGEKLKACGVLSKKLWQCYRDQALKQANKR